MQMLLKKNVTKSGSAGSWREVRVVLIADSAERNQQHIKVNTQAVAHVSTHESQREKRLAALSLRDARSFLALLVAESVAGDFL